MASPNGPPPPGFCRPVSVPPPAEYRQGQQISYSSGNATPCANFVSIPVPTMDSGFVSPPKCNLTRDSSAGEVLSSTPRFPSAPANAAEFLRLNSTQQNATAFERPPVTYHSAPVEPRVQDTFFATPGVNNVCNRVHEGASNVYDHNFSVPASVGNVLNTNNAAAGVQTPNRQQCNIHPPRQWDPSTRLPTHDVASEALHANPFHQFYNMSPQFLQNPSPAHRDNSLAQTVVRRLENMPTLPPFKPAHPEFWFNLVEQTFNVYGLDDDARFYCLVNHLHERVELIYDLVKNPPSTGKYTAAKQTILQRVSKTRRENVRQLIYEERLGDRSPSQLWRCLRLLVSEHDLPNDTLTEIWTEKLPLPVQTAISAYEDRSVNELLRAADRVHSARLRELRASASRPSNTRPVKSVALPAPSSRRSDGASDAAEDHGSQLPPPPAMTYCFFHYRFGEQARNCKPPCSYPNYNRR